MNHYNYHRMTTCHWLDHSNHYHACLKTCIMNNIKNTIISGKF